MGNALSVFFDAAKSGDTEEVREFIELGLDVDTADSQGNTALYYACQNNQVKTARYLLRHKADTEKGKHFNPLCIATINGHLEIVKVLLTEAESNVEYKSAEGKTALWLASATGSLSIVKQLIHHKARLTVRTNNEEISPLWVACQNGHYAVVKFLVEKGAEVDVRNKNQATPLFIASQKGHKNIVDLLLRHKAEVNATRLDNCTPLHLAVYNRHETIAQVLLKSGANVNAVWWMSSLTPLHIACYHGDLSMVNMLLTKKADTSVKMSEEATPLCVAAYLDHTDIVTRLLEHGVDIEAKTKSGDTALIITCFMNNIKTLKKLCFWGADVNAADNEGNTGLHAASQECHSRVIKYLLENNAKVTCNFHGLTPSQTTELKGNSVNKKLKELETTENEDGSPGVTRETRESKEVTRVHSESEVNKNPQQSQEIVVNGNSIYPQISTLLTEYQQKNTTVFGNSDLTDHQLLNIAMAVGGKWKVLGGLLNIPYTDILKLAISGPSSQHDEVFKGWTMLVLWRDLTGIFSTDLKKFQLKMALSGLGMPQTGLLMGLNSGPEKCINGSDSCNSGPEKWINRSDSCNSGPEKCINMSDSCNSRLRTLVKTGRRRTVRR